MFKKLYPSFIAGASLLPLVAGAQGEINNIITRAGQTMQLVISLLFVLATLVFLWGVVQFIARSGDEAARAKAKGIMTWGIVGLAIMAAAWGVVTLLLNYFQIPSQGSPGIIPPPTRF